MKALLLAAGLGTRLRPLTETIPKCLVPINGVPLLEIWLEKLIQSGVNEFLINTHYLHDEVESFISTSPYSNKIKTVYEEKLLGTAGTLLKNIDFFANGDGLLIHADNYCQANMNEFISSFKKRPEKSLMTMMTFLTDRPRECGIVVLDNEGMVIEFHEKKNNPPGNIANGAIYIFSGGLIKMLESINPHSVTDFSIDLIPKLLGKISTYHTLEKLIDIGTPEAYRRCNE